MPTRYKRKVILQTLQKLNKLPLPYELRKPSRAEAEEAVRTLIRFIGDDPTREGLLSTPSRVLKAWEKDWGLGYDDTYRLTQTTSILGGQFADGRQTLSQLIAVQGIKYNSHCEHHMSPFHGTVDIGYIPRKGGRILGLSKLVRVVDMFSKRLQVQERLTDQVADFINVHCKPLGVGVLIRGYHTCMTTRGVKQHEVVAVTSALRGEMLTKPEVRAEFLQLVRKK